MSMTMPYNLKAKKKATNLSINSDLLEQAKKLNINLSKCLESSLEQKVRETKTANWQEENKEAIEHYNERVEKYGVFSDGMRSF